MRVGVFGWGLVAPKSPNIEVFRKNLESAESWLGPFNGFGPDNFLVGQPEFCFGDYQQWIGQRFAPRHFQKLKEKMDFPALYAIGAFIQSLEQNPGIEAELQSLGSLAHVYVGTGLGALETSYRESVRLFQSQRRWNRFWAQPDRNSVLKAFAGNGASGDASRDNLMPAPPEAFEGEEREAADAEWNAYWMERSPQLHEYLAELAEIDGLVIEGAIESGKLHAIREKEKRHTKLQEKWGAPDPPWNVSANLIWNIHNTPAAQISILGQITGLSFAPVAACSTFGVALDLAMRAIRCGDAKAVVVGATDPPPHPLTVGSFYSARVLSADRQLSLPLTRLRGTHVAGGSVVWIVGDYDYLTGMGFQALGMEPLAVGVSCDADHIITPSADGPKIAIDEALAHSGADASELGTWDLHATATPGDYSEVRTLRTVVPDSVLVTARKGTFGHGMSAGGGWELTAQYLGFERGQLYPTPLKESELNGLIHEVHSSFVFDQGENTTARLAGKLSMGIGGINACVISRPLPRK